MSNQQNNSQGKQGQSGQKVQRQDSNNNVEMGADPTADLKNQLLGFQNQLQNQTQNLGQNQFGGLMGMNQLGGMSGFGMGGNNQNSQLLSLMGQLGGNNNKTQNQSQTQNQFSSMNQSFQGYNQGTY